jgi:hypothetical protein
MLWLTGLLECRSFLCVRSCRPPSESFSTRAFKVRSLANVHSALLGHARASSFAV